MNIQDTHCGILTDDFTGIQSIKFIQVAGRPYHYFHLEVLDPSEIGSCFFELQAINDQAFLFCKPTNDTCREAVFVFETGDRLILAKDFKISHPDLTLFASIDLIKVKVIGYKRMIVVGPTEKRSTFYGYSKPDETKSLIRIMASRLLTALQPPTSSARETPGII